MIKLNRDGQTSTFLDRFYDAPLPRDFCTLCRGMLVGTAKAISIYFACTAVVMMILLGFLGWGLQAFSDFGPMQIAQALEEADEGVMINLIVMGMVVDAIILLIALIAGAVFCCRQLWQMTAVPAQQLQSVQNVQSVYASFKEKYCPTVVWLYREEDNANEG